MRRRLTPLLAGFCLASVALCGANAQAATTHPMAGNPVAVRAYAHELQKINPLLPQWQSRLLARHLLINANRWRIDANMLAALVTVESSWHTHARSWAGAMGLGQLMPGTAKRLHVNPRDPYENLQGAARYLYGLLKRFSGKPDRYALAFAAYNAGPRAVEQFGGIPPYAETQNYVVKVMRAWHHISSVVHVPAAPHPAIATAPSAPDVSYWIGDSR